MAVIDKSTSDTLSNLIARIALRDRSSFEKLYHLTSAKLFGVVFRILKDKSESEDALQEIYIKIWRNADKYALDKYNPMSWLVVIARNHAIDIIRSRKPTSIDIDEVNNISGDAKNPEDMAISNSQGRQIDNCLSKLEEKKSQAVRSAYIDGYSYDELAQRFSVPLNTMRTWLRRSLLSLRECLRDDVAG